MAGWGINWKEPSILRDTLTILGADVILLITVAYFLPWNFADTNSLLFSVAILLILNLLVYLGLRTVFDKFDWNEFAVLMDMGIVWIAFQVEILLSIGFNSSAFSADVWGRLLENAGLQAVETAVAVLILFYLSRRLDD